MSNTATNIGKINKALTDTNIFNFIGYLSDTSDEKKLNINKTPCAFISYNGSKLEKKTNKQYINMQLYTVIVAFANNTIQNKNTETDTANQLDIIVSFLVKEFSSKINLSSMYILSKQENKSIWSIEFDILDTYDFN